VPVELLNQPASEWPTLLSSMFLHGGWAHLLGNMLYLWVFGDNLEDTMGSFRFVIFYLASGLVATAAQVAISPQSTVPTIGASGAIAGVLGGYLLLFPRARITTIVFRFVTEVPAVIVLGFWFVYQFFFGIASLSTMDVQVGGIAFFAHIGGFVAGMILVHPFQIGRPSPRGAARSLEDLWG
jgi:membrane associated rhomboid family serine protease